MHHDHHVDKMILLSSTKCGFTTRLALRQCYGSITAVKRRTTGTGAMIHASDVGAKIAMHDGGYRQKSTYSMPKSFPMQNIYFCNI
jgi:hypothetical protein